MHQLITVLVLQMCLCIIQRPRAVSSKTTHGNKTLIRTKMPFPVSPLTQNSLLVAASFIQKPCNI